MADTTYRSSIRGAGDDLSNLANDAADTASRVADDVSGVASRVTDRASEIGRKAVDQLGATAEYFRSHDMNDVLSDAKSWVRSNPTQALIAAAAVGFLAATVIRRR